MIGFYQSKQTGNLALQIKGDIYSFFTPSQGEKFESLDEWVKWAEEMRFFLSTHTHRKEMYKPISRAEAVAIWNDLTEKWGD